MTWTINIGGHNQHDSEEEHRSFEEDLADRVRDFVKTLDGATTATVTGNKIGTVNALSQ
jgi:hypothetical protein